MSMIIDKALAVNGTGTAIIGEGNIPGLGIITKDMSLPGVIALILNWVLVIAGALAVVYLVYAGIQYITAGGDTEKAGQARQGIIHAVIGIVIIALALLIVRWVKGALGIVQ